MARGEEIPESIRNQMIGMRKAGSTFVAIGAEYNVSEDTVRKIYNRWVETGDCENAPRSGRPKILTKHDIRHIKAHVTTDRETRREPLGEIIQHCNLPISTKTLSRTIVNCIGMGRRIERKRCFLTPSQMAYRLKFTKAHIHWTLEDWRRVAFSDEMAMQTDSNQGRVFVWRYPEEEYHMDCIRGTVISGFQKVKVWGAMRYGKLSNLVMVPEEKGEGKMTAAKYLAVIMDGEMFDFWMEGMEDVGYLLMMEDGAPYHKGVASQRRMELEKDGWIGWGPGTWPASSPDLNPIENLWHILRSKIRKRKQQPRTKDALIEALKEEWANLDMGIVNDLIDSMPRRMQAVIDAKGGPTKY
jgi:transposase